MKVFAPAKVNLALHVIGQRPDGYHLIESLIAFADVGDVLTISPARADGATYSGPFGGALASDPAPNLVLRARDVLRAAAGSRPCPPVALHLEKNLPLASGIGGGSADAAAALNGLNTHWRLGFTADQLCAIGLPLGADVPMCLHGVPLVASGIGEMIEPVALPRLHLLLVNPGVAVPTPAIFKMLAEKSNGALPALAHAEPGSLARLADHLKSTRNDLESPARSLQPVIGDVIAALVQAGALFARMSGSGATCFGIFADQLARDRAAMAIRSAHSGWWVG